MIKQVISLKRTGDKYGNYVFLPQIIVITIVFGGGLFYFQPQNSLGLLLLLVISSLSLLIMGFIFKILFLAKFISIFKTWPGIKRTNIKAQKKIDQKLKNMAKKYHEAIQEGDEELVQIAKHNFWSKWMLAELYGFERRKKYKEYL